MSLATGPVWMFCPADRPDRYAKAAAAADVVILDLEDAVAPGAKAAARQALINTPLDPARTVVRVNGAATADHQLDLDTVRQTQYRALMLAKSETAAQVTALAPWAVVALIESPLGALNVNDIAQAHNAVGLMWGAEDLIAGLGGRSSRHPDGSYRDIARQVRSSVLLAAKVYGRFALDSVYLNIADLDGLRDESSDATATGFDGKVALHPTQVPVIRQAYAPSAGELAWAQAVLAAADGQPGVFAFEGKMVDAPVLRHAERIVSAAANVRAR